MPRPRFFRLAPEKQRAILDAATAEFAAHGFSKAAYNTIIARAGVSKGAMYYYFDDKADLYTTVVERILDPFLRAFEERSAADSPQAFWAGLGQTAANMAPLLQNPDAIALLRDCFSQRHGGQSDAAVKRLTERFFQLMLPIVEEGRALGAVRTDLPADLLTAQLMGFGEASDLWFLQNLDKLEPSEVMRLYGVVFSMLRQLASPPLEAPTAQPRTS